MMLSTPHQTIFMLRNIMHNLEDHPEVSYNTPHFTAAKPKAIIFINCERAVSRITTTPSNFTVKNLCQSEVS